MHLSDRFTSGIVPIMAVSVLALYIALVLYMAIEAWPALIHMSWTDIVTGTVWKPMAQSPVLGLAYIISASLYVLRPAGLVNQELALYLQTTHITSGLSLEQQDISRQR